jgi:uncharacterized protein (DUF433 family)
MGCRVAGNAMILAQVNALRQQCQKVVPSDGEISLAKTTLKRYNEHRLVQPALAGPRVSRQHSNCRREGMTKQILMDPDKFLGEPYIAGTSLPVLAVVRLTGAGLEPEEISTAYPELTVEDVKAALDYHAKRSGSASR